MDTIKINKKNTLMIAHRGLSKLERENTALAFVAAGNRTYYGCECDVRKTIDGQYVISHDADLKRNAGKEINIKDCTYDELLEVNLYDIFNIPRDYYKILLLEDYIKICTVIGFPNGYSTTEVKVFETENAVKNGADEIDMVINIGQLKEKNYDFIEKEIKQVKKACGKALLKVIIETCLLTDEEKIKMCEICAKAGADYIKTSTGFSKSGATLEDVKLMRENSPSTLKVKAAGGISGIADAEEFIKLGAERIGTSRVVREILKTE